MHAPVKTIAQIISRPDFVWDRKTINALLHRRGCRRHPTIRTWLIQKADVPGDLLMLLKDRKPKETRFLWKCLAQMSPQLAIDHLEKNGFDPRVGWQLKDLTVLFQGSAEITVQATLLAAELRRMLEGRHESIEPPPSKPKIRPARSR